MIIVKLNGGLGNQMFQYALGRMLAIKNKTRLKLDLTSFYHTKKSDTPRKYSLNVFNLPEDTLFYKPILPKSTITKKIHTLISKNSEKKNNIVIEKNYKFDKNILNSPNNTKLIGYWQSEKYFNDIEKILKNDFTFPQKTSSKNNKLINSIKKENSISIHVRRGDYVKVKKTKEYHGILGVKYYQKAIKIINNKVNKPSWYVFSDDINWCRKNIKPDKNIKYIDHNRGDKSYEDMRLMSLCKHNIVANSSFSWWGAWLNSNMSKIVIATNKWFSNVSINTDDLIPSEWKKI